MKAPPSNLPASIRARRLAHSREAGEDFGLILSRFAAERLLYRIAQSEHRNRFFLKGALLFALWEGNPHRPTRDVDLLGQGSSDVDELAAVFRTLCAMTVEPDGLEFDPASVQAFEIREDHHYDGVRVKLTATLSGARVDMQVDIGFGDAVTPPATEVSFPTLLDLPAPRLNVYPIETVIAEKLEALVSLGIANSRMKDFYDLAFVARRRALSASILVEAVRATFGRRRTTLPEALPIGLADEFAEDSEKIMQWSAFVRRARLSDATDLRSVVLLLREFLWPIVQYARIAEAAADTEGLLWAPGGPWRRA